MVKTTLKLAQPANFNFKRTVLSHGWYDLKPFELDKEKWILTRVFEQAGAAAPVSAKITAVDNEIEITVNAQINEVNAVKIADNVRHILRLDEDLSEFYNLTEGDKQLVWISESGAGRLLRSPTVWEDLVKSICTTNCSWALTRKMVEKLVEKLGESTTDGTQKSFPSAKKMAAQTIEFYQNEIRAGYRSTYFADLARQVANDEIEVESWANSELPTVELKKQIKQIKGVGDYAAENLLKLLGRYDGLALDSWLRMRFAQTHNNGEKCLDATIYAHYEKFADWRGLVIWCEMTKNWL